MKGWNTIEISIYDIKFCPYCGTKLEKSTYYHPGDDVVCEGTKHKIKCPNCKIKY